MVEEDIARGGKPTGHNGKPLHGGTTVKTSIQVLCTLFLRVVDAVPNQDLSTTWIDAIPGLQIIH